MGFATRWNEGRHVVVDVEQAAARARLYQLLAEALADPPDWLSQASRQWPLSDAAEEVAHLEDNQAILQAAAAQTAIPPEDIVKRRARYEALFTGHGSSIHWLYESLARDGQLAGPSCQAVWSVYEAAGLVVAGTELPDHASVELAFLAYLTGQEAENPTKAVQWRHIRRLFLSRHAGRWLPALGDALARTGDLVYGPIGRLLAAVLRTDLRQSRTPTKQTNRRLPVLLKPQMCNLCGFCVQVCPTHALAIRETETTTSLLVSDSACVACERCVRICMTGVLGLAPSVPREGRSLLRQSPRAHCPGCGQPLISEAELAAVAARIGAPSWLNYCPDCRSLLLERAL